MVLSRIHNIGLKAIDLLILSVALLLISSSAIVSGDIEIISLDFLSLFFIVVVVYGVTVLVVGILCMSIGTDNWLGRVSKAAISGMLVFLMFPWLIDLLMFITRYKLVADAQSILFVCVIIRAVVRSLLGRYWDQGVV